MDEFIKDSIVKTGLPFEVTEEIKTSFSKLGVLEPSDIKFVTEGDLTGSGTLKLVQARKLMAYWKSLGYVHQLLICHSTL